MATAEEGFRVDISPSRKLHALQFFAGCLGFLAINAGLTLLWIWGHRGPLIIPAPMGSAALFLGLNIFCASLMVRLPLGFIERRFSLGASSHRWLHFFLALLLGLTALETSCYSLNAFSKDCLHEGVKGFLVHHPDLGYQARPGFSSAVRKIAKNGDTIYQATYRINPFGHRTTTPSTKEIPAFFALFFGCSFTFGDGLEENQTIPSLCTRANPDFQGYNFGISGYGPQHMLEILSKEKIPAEVKEKTGIGIYTFIDAHISRAIGSLMVTVTNKGMGFPYYSLSPEGTLIHDGNFGMGRPFISYAYQLIAQDPICRLFSIEIPLWISGEDRLLTARLIEASQQEFLKRFPQGEFWLVFFPQSRESASIKTLLAGKNIRFIDLSALPGFDRPDHYFHYEDRHPSALAIAEVARQLQPFFASFLSAHPL